MITAIDTSVLIALYRGEASANQWMEALIQARIEGALVICDVVAAELYAIVEDRPLYDAFLQDLGIRLSPTSMEAACLAGQSFKAYRSRGGPRKYLIPDFLIAAHAQTDAHRLAAADRGYLRSCFPQLQLLTVL